VGALPRKRQAEKRKNKEKAEKEGWGVGEKKKMITGAWPRIGGWRNKLDMHYGKKSGSNRHS